MSLVTRCPACETLFKVVPDQLRVSEGWVRCGQCDTVFDASLHLLQAVPGPVPQPTDSEPTPEFEERLAAGAWVEPEPEVEVEPELLPELQPEPEPEPEPAQAQVPDQVLPLRAQELNSTPDIHLSSLQAQRGNPGLMDDQDLPSGRDDGLGEASVLPTASFLRRPDSRTPPRAPRRTTLRVLLSLLLLLGFLGQVVVQERDRLAVWQPAVQPLLLALCVPLNCHLSPLRRIEAIVIDSSSFTKVQGEFYRLKLTLKNTADTALAVPAIELTLTDAMDQAVLRRVFLPAELEASSDALAAGALWSPSLMLAVSPGEPVEAMMGYRLLAFYP